MEKVKIHELQNIAQQARKLMVETLITAQAGHPGGAFSSIDTIVTLYFTVLKVDPQNPRLPERDRFILSKGHSSIALYTVLYLKGFISRETLLTFRQDNSKLCGHPDMHKVPGVEMSTGSLGHGLSVGVGISLAGKKDNLKYRTFVLLGDGETQEGSVWESAMSASHYQLDNLIAIVDRNTLQIDGSTEDIMALEPYKSKWESFGWSVKEIDGHNFEQLVSTFHSVPFVRNKPSLVIAKTVKGKGVSFMENKSEWHGKAIKDEYAEIARREMNI